MERTLTYDGGLAKYQPLRHIICYDDFDRGPSGWLNLMPNYTLENFGVRKSIVEKTQWGPIMLSSATFRFPGTHGSMNGTYSLKLATRPTAWKYEGPPAPGSVSHAIKRLTTHRKPGLLQFEMWYAYKPEQDRIGLSEKDIRAFGICFDMQDAKARNFVGVRYVNSVNGEMKKEWQYMQAADVSDEEWAYDTSGDWCKRGIDPIWYGKRYPDGATDGFKFVPGGRQELCYNESDDKINWLYLRLLYDTAKKQYVEFQSKDQVFDLRGKSPSDTPPYARIEGLLNPVIWVETDTDRRAFLFVDSVVISME
ncbi:hypothetical protein EDD80_11075 [Anseongella ginsenosidimutans]|uniref:Uncharacterized protein n=1 Tax=Anseongella ginsenosidimutans TaxID=496056 RepID=A0A4R3KN67_9SPHI|nr:DUF6772 family protein [Anseongella ginsenosidimutans]QEC52382.1 hypothetical protein FRZ59_08580 [Anseongella ginsenosidimutans]TCS85877.1 hypothetical protein EDD80_11075 [Anseongella ginsenosidimutans]